MGEIFLVGASRFERPTTDPPCQCATRLRHAPNLVPKAGLEPARAIAHYPLKIARLPVPPLRHAEWNLAL